MAICWSDGGTYDAKEWNLTGDSFDRDHMHWTISGSGPATIDSDSGVISFGTGCGTYTVTASAGDGACSASFDLTVVKIVFDPASDAVVWSDSGTYNVATKLTSDSTPSASLSWRTVNSPDSSFNPVTGVVTFGGKGEKVIVEADYLGCTNQFELKVIKIDFPPGLVTVCNCDPFYNAKSRLTTDSYDMDRVHWSIDDPNPGFTIDDDGLVSFNSYAGAVTVRAQSLDASSAEDAFTLRALPMVVELNTDQVIVPWTPGGTYNALPHVVVPPGAPYTWDIDPALSISGSGLITFGTGGGQYEVYANTAGPDDCGDHLTLRIIKVEFSEPAVTICHGAGVYEASGNLTNGTYDVTNLSWSIISPASPLSTIDSTGKVTFGDKGETLVIQATSLDDPSVSASFQLTIVRLYSMNVSTAPLPPDGRSTSQASIKTEPPGRTVKWDFDGDRLGCVINRDTGLITAGDRRGRVTILAYDEELDYCKKEGQLLVDCDCSGRTCLPGEAFMELSSIDVSWGLGAGQDGKSASHIMLSAKSVNTTLSSPRSLEYYLSRSDVEVLKDENEVLRQIKAPQALADIVVIDDLKYEIRFYELNAIGAKNQQGYYEITGSPFVTWVVENPDTSGQTYNRLRLTKVVNSYSEVNEYVYDETTDEWSLSRGGGLQVESFTETVDEGTGNRTLDRVMKDGEGHVVSEQVEVYHEFPWGECLIENIQDPDGAALTSSTTYYESPEETGRYGQVAQEIQPNGSWKKYDYDSAGRPTMEVETWLDSSTSSIPEEASATYYDYASLDAQDTVLPDDRRPRTITRNVLGVTVGKTFNVYKQVDGDDVHVVEEAAAADASFGDARNLRTITTSYVTNHSNGAAAGKTKSVQSASGQWASYTYEYGVYTAGQNPGDIGFESGGGTDIRQVFTQGTTTHPDGIAHKTTRSIVYYDGEGHALFEETYVFTGSDYERISWVQHVCDSFGRETTVYRSNGTVKESFWGSACCGLESEIDEYGIQTYYSYDQLHRMISTTKAGVSPQPDIVTAYVYDANGRKVQETTSAGDLSLTTHDQYDGAGQVTNSIDAVGLSTRTAYAEGGRLVTVTRPGGGTEITEYYPDGQIKSVTGTAVVPTYYEYGVNENGTRWTLTRTGRADSPAWEKTTTDMLGRTLKTEKPGYNGTTQTVSYTYNNLGQLIQTANEGYASTLYVYDELGNQVQQGLDVDANGVLEADSTDRITESDTSYSYEVARWWLKSQSLVYGGSNDVPILSGSQKSGLTGFSSGITEETFSYDIHTNVTRSYTIVDRDNKQVTRITDYPDSASNEVSITVNGLLVSSTGKTGVQRLFAYDGLGRQVGVTDPRTGTTTTHYNENGQVDYTEDSAGNRTSYLYDEVTGLQIRVTDPLLNAVHTAYDSQGRVVGTWGATYPVLYDYDDYGRMSAMYTLRDNEIGANTSYSGFRSQISGFDKTSWFYDEATGLLTNKQDAAGKGPVYTYTPDGLLATRTWARLKDGNSLVTTYTYDPITRELTNTDYSDNTPDVGYTYDRMGRPLTISDILGTRTNAYDDSTLQLISENLANGTVLARNYDSLGRSSGLSLGSDYSLTYAYQNIGRFASVSSSVASVISVVEYSYLPLSDQLSQISNFEFQVSYSYAPNLDIRTQVLNTAGSTIVSRYNYTHDAAGRRSRVDWADGTYWQYGYDARGQVVSANKHWSNGMPVAGQQYGYGYDPIGNRKTTDHGPWVADYTANQLNQYTERTVPGVVDVMGTAEGVVNVNGWPAMKQGNYFYAGLGVDNSATSVFTEVNVASVQQHAGPNGEDIVDEDSGNAFVPETPEQFEYDEDGNLIRDGRWEYTWDCENRLVSMETRDDLANATPRKRLEFTYDYQGRRTGKKVYDWDTDRWSQVTEHSFVYDGWNLIQELITNNESPITNSYIWSLDLSGTLQGAGGVGGLLSVVSGPSSAAYYAAYDGNGNITEYLDENGETVAHREYDPFGGTIVSTGDKKNDFEYWFSTKYTDEETGLLYFGFRFYSPQIGRWLSRDPVDEVGGVNLYTLVQNAPLYTVDVFGKWGLNVHFLQTADWAEIAGFERRYSSLVGQADEGVDHGGTSPMPWGNQDRHMMYMRGGMDSRDWWYDYEFRVGVNYLDRGDRLADPMACIEAARAFGRGLHSRQDRSAHRPWPGGGNWHAWTVHPAWWDDWYGQVDAGSHADDRFWRRTNQQPDYYIWIGSPAQRRSQDNARGVVEGDSRQALDEIVGRIRRCCYCKLRMLKDP